MKRPVFKITPDISINSNFVIDINDKNVTIRKIFKKFYSKINNPESKEVIMKIEFIDKQKDLIYHQDNDLNYNIKLDQLEKENSQIKQILMTVKDQNLNIPICKAEDKKILSKKSDYKKLIHQKIETAERPNIFEIIKTENSKEKLGYELDIFEVALIEIVMEKFEFKDFNNYIYFYLNDNLKKMREANPIKDIRIIDQCRKQVEQYLFNLKEEIKELYRLKLEMIKLSCSGYEIKICNETDEDKERKSFEELTITCIISTKIKGFSDLDLNQFYVLNENVLIILTALKANNSVEKLILTTNKLGIEGAWGLPRIFLFNKKLQYIDISSNGLDDSHIKIISQGIDNLYQEKINLKYLNISSNQNLSGKNYAEYLAKIIDKTDNLETLNINKTALGEGFEKLILAFIRKIETSQKSSIKSIYGYTNNIDSASLMQLANFLSKPLCSLSLIVLSDNKFDNDGGVKLFKALADNSSVKEIYLHDCFLDDNFCSLLIDIIKRNKNIRELSLYNNKFTISTVRKVLDNLNNNFESDDIIMVDANDSNMIVIDNKKFELKKLDLSKSSSNKDNLSKFDYEILKILLSLEGKLKKENRKFVLDLSNLFKIDLNAEDDLNKINPLFLKINY